MEKGQVGPPLLSAPAEDSIAWAIACLRDNHQYGWYEIAGTRGFANCLREGGIATRIDGAVRYHRTVKEAALRIAETDAT